MRISDWSSDVCSSDLDGAAAFDANLTTHAGYAQIQAELIPGVNINAGVRYEDATQTVVPVDLFNTGSSVFVPTDLDNAYWLPAVTLTWAMAPDKIGRASWRERVCRYV